jgi:hypothetical protein
MITYTDLLREYVRPVGGRSLKIMQPRALR